MPAKFSNSFLLIVFSVFVFLFLPFISTDATIDPEQAPRFFLTSVMVLGISLYFLRIKLLQPNLTSPEYKIFLLLILSLFWMMISIVWSVNKGDAFAEWLRLAVLFSACFIAFLIFKQTTNYRLIFIRSSALAVIIFSIYGFNQLYTPLMSYLSGTPMRVAYDITSTLSNKNFFSEVLVLFLPLLIYGLVADTKAWKIIFLISLLSDLFFIVLLQSIAAWLSIFLSIIFYLIIAYRNKISLINFKISKTRRWFIIFSSIALFLIALIAFTKTSNFDWLTSKVKFANEYISNPELLATSSDLNNNSVFDRIILWRNSTRMIKDHPFIGVGLNNWKLINPSYGIGGTDFIDNGFTNYEHPHNEYLLILAEQGPPGLILYLLFLIFLMQAGLRKLKTTDENSKRLILLLLCGIVAFIILSFFSYPRTRFYSMLLMLICSAFMLSIYPDNTGKAMQLKIIFVFISIVSVLGCVAAYYKYTGDLHIKNTMMAQAKENFPRMIRESEKAYSWFFPLDLTGTPVQWYRGMAFFYDGKFDLAKKEYEKAIKINPNHLRVLNDLATSYEQSGEREKAIYYYRKALVISPSFIEANVNLSAAYFNIGRIDSSFYFIDKLYNFKNITMSGNYNLFLDAILNIKATQILKMNSDTTIVSDKILLKEIYVASKKENKSFDDYLINFKKRNKIKQ